MAQLFNKITREALGLLERKIITGFNKEDDAFLNCVSLLIKYYHANRKHIEDFKSDICTEFESKFKQRLQYQEHFKEGIFVWKFDFILGAGNKYFYVAKRGKEYIIEEICFEQIVPNPIEGFYIAKDDAKVIDFKIIHENEANFIVDYIRKNYSRLFYRNGKLEEQAVKDERSETIPLVVVKDNKNLITDKSLLREVVNLKFTKEGVCFQSLILPSQLKSVFKKLNQYPCEFQMEKEKRYVTPEVFYGYF